MSGIGLPELLIVLAILLVFFGAKRLPTLARSMGQASKEFKTGMKEGYTEAPVEGPCPFCGTEVVKDAKFCSNCGKPAEEIIAARSKEQTPKSA